MCLKKKKKSINKKNIYESEESIERPKQYIDCLIDPSFQGRNRHFILPFGNNDHQTSSMQYIFPAVEIKDHNIMTD